MSTSALSAFPLHEAFARLPVPCVVLRGRLIEFANERFLSLAGLSFAEALGLPFTKGLAPADAARLEALQGTPAEVRFTTPVGWLKDTAPAFEVVITPLDGVRSLLTLLAQDPAPMQVPTERHHADTDLREREERLRLALQAADIGIWDWNIRDNTIRRWGGEAARYGRPAEATGTFETFLNVIHAKDRDRVREAIEAAVQTGVAYDIEFRSVWADGSIHWVHSKGNVLRDAKGAPVRMLGYIRDVTRRKQEQNALAESDARLRLAIDATGIALWDWNLKTGRVDVSLGAELIFGKTLEGMDNDRFMEFIAPEDRRRVVREVTQIILGGAGVLETEYRLQVGNRWVRTHGRIFRTPEGTPVRVLGYTLDITHQKEHERELLAAKEAAEEASRLKSSILANLSHEIRTPMTAILGFAELLEHKLAGSSLQGDARIIRNGGKRLLHLLNSIIDLARIEAGRMPFEPTRHDLAQTVQRVIGLFGQRAAEKGIDLRLAAEAGTMVFTDSSAVEQIVTNLVSNAIQFTERGHVTVGACRQGERGVVRVADTGIGITAEFLPYLFDEFRQESEGMGRRYEGSGLGLAITRKLIDRLAGTIEVRSEKGAGTTVTITFPLARNADDVPEGAVDSAGAPSAAALARSVLAVDDDPSCGSLVEAALDGHRVIWCETAEAALALAAQTRFDIVLMDIHLRKGEMDGIEAMRQLRDMPAYAESRIVALTAYAMKGDREMFLEQGFSDYLAKPFEPAALRQLVDRD